MSDTGAVPSGSFAVDLPVFTGPFRLLAELIMEQKVDVCDIAVSTVTDGYLAHAKEAEGWNLEEATWFLAICAMLLELKVGRLMPRHTEQDEEDLLGASPDLAYARSIELAAFRRVAVEIARRLEDEAGFFARDVGPGPEFSRLYPDPMESIVAEDLARVAAQLLRPPPTLDLSHVTPIRYSVEDAMTAVQERMADFGGPRRSATWWRTARTGSTWWCGSWPSSSCTVKARSSFSRDRRSERSRSSGMPEPEMHVDSARPDRTRGRSRRCSSSRTSRSPHPCSPRRSTSIGAPSRVSATDWRRSWRTAAPAWSCATSRADGVCTHTRTPHPSSSSSSSPRDRRG